jgi:hypothetical protein
MRSPIGSAAGGYRGLTKISRKLHDTRFRANMRGDSKAFKRISTGFGVFAEIRVRVTSCRPRADPTPRDAFRWNRRQGRSGGIRFNVWRGLDFCPTGPPRRATGTSGPRVVSTCTDLSRTISTIQCQKPPESDSRLDILGRSGSLPAAVERREKRGRERSSARSDRIRSGRVPGVHDCRCARSSSGRTGLMREPVAGRATADGRGTPVCVRGQPSCRPDGLTACKKLDRPVGAVSCPPFGHR